MKSIENHRQKYKEAFALHPDEQVFKKAIAWNILNIAHYLQQEKEKGQSYECTSEILSSEYAINILKKYIRSYWRRFIDGITGNCSYDPEKINILLQEHKMNIILNKNSDIIN